MTFFLADVRLVDVEKTIVVPVAGKSFLLETIVPIKKEQNGVWTKKYKKDARKLFPEFMYRRELFAFVYPLVN